MGSRVPANQRAFDYFTEAAECRELSGYATVSSTRAPNVSIPSGSATVRGSYFIESLIPLLLTLVRSLQLVLGVWRKPASLYNLLSPPRSGKLI